MKQIIYRLDVLAPESGASYQMAFGILGEQFVILCRVDQLFHRGSLPGARSGHGVVDRPWSQSRETGKAVFYPKSSCPPIITLGYNQWSRGTEERNRAVFPCRPCPTTFRWSKGSVRCRVSQRKWPNWILKPDWTGLDGKRKPASGLCMFRSGSVTSAQIMLHAEPSPLPWMVHCPLWSLPAMCYCHSNLA
jgi:hypothetical protein